MIIEGEKMGGTPNSRKEQRKEWWGFMLYIYKKKEVFVQKEWIDTTQHTSHHTSTLQLHLTLTSHSLHFTTHFSS